MGAFTAELTEAGASTWPSTIGGAGPSAPDTPSPQPSPTSGRRAATPARPPARFACWLMVTARMSVSAEYLARAEPAAGLHRRPPSPRPARPARRHRAHARLRRGAGARPVVRVRTAGRAARRPSRAGDLRAARLRRRRSARRVRPPGHPKAGHKLRSALVRLRATLYHAGMTDTLPRLHRPNRGVVASAQWAAVAPGLAATARRYLAQIELSLRPRTVRIAEQALRELGSFLAREAPGVSCAADIGRHHIEAYKSWLAHRPEPVAAPCTGTPSAGTRQRCVASSTGSPNGAIPRAVPSADLRQDLPIPDQPLPRFLDDAASAKLLRAARADPDPFARLVIELLARTGLRQGRADGARHRRRRADRLRLLAPSRSASCTTTATSRCTHSSRHCSIDGWPTGPVACARPDLPGPGAAIPPARVDRA